MQHCDEDTLSLAALGEPTSTEVEAHLSQCTTCRRELQALQDVVDVARQAQPAAVVPPPSVWAGIAAATGVSSEPRPERVAAGATTWGGGGGLGGQEPAGTFDAASTYAPHEAFDSPSVAQPAGLPGDELAERRRSRRRPPRRSRWTILGVAAAGLAIGAVCGSAVTAFVDDDSPTQVIVAATPLNGLAPDPRATGEATVVRTSAGGRLLEVDVSQVAGTTDGFYEVWLIDADVKRMIPVGILSGSSGQFVLPDGVDLSQYPVVDVSEEPLDGDPTHSGKSILRGSIKT